MAKMQKQEAEMLTHLIESCEKQITALPEYVDSDENAWSGSAVNIDATQNASTTGEASDNTLNDYDSYSSKALDINDNGQEVFSQDFYANFPLFDWGLDPFDENNGFVSSETYFESDTTTQYSGLLPDTNVGFLPRMAFVDNLISLELDDLPEDDRHCPICLQGYRTGESGEIPLELPCGHVMGRVCLLASFLTSPASEDDQQAVGCPICCDGCSTA